MVAAPEVFGLWTELRVGLGDFFRFGLAAEFFDVLGVRGFFGGLYRYDDGPNDYGSLTGLGLSAFVWSPGPVRLKVVGEVARYCVAPADGLAVFRTGTFSVTGASGPLYGVGGAIELALSTSWALELEGTGRRYDGTIEGNVWVVRGEEIDSLEATRDDDAWTTVVGLSIRARLL
ncbi:MAG: hypothetical protein KC583_03625 [Myxococcales bacterium]|nr:hypothetical protein [Myxococcales bacterium]